MHHLAMTSGRQRPLSFNVLCVLAFGFGGISIIVNLYLILTGTLSQSYREFAVVQNFLGSSAEYHGMIYSFLGLALSVVAFFGVIQMWNQLRSGFWLFVIAKITYLILPFFLLNVVFIYLVYLMLPFTIMVMVFIILFSFNFRYLY